MDSTKPEAATSAWSALLGEIAAEVTRACAKFPTWPTDPLHALAVLGEEYGELTKDMLQLCYEPHKTSRENVRKEAMQTAAMAVLRRLTFGEWHEQTICNGRCNRSRLGDDDSGLVRTGRLHPACARPLD